MGLRLELLVNGSVDYDSEGVLNEYPIRVYNIDGDFSSEEIEIVRSFLADPITETGAANSSVLGDIPEDCTVMEVFPKKGVTDPDGMRIRKAIEDLLERDVGQVSRSDQFVYKGLLDDNVELDLKKRLGNLTVNDFEFIPGTEWDPENGMGYRVPIVDLPDVPAFIYSRHKDKVVEFLDMNETELLDSNNDYRWALSLEEMQTIKDLFSDKNFIEARKKVGLDAKPTDAELQNLGQTWSEHCKHKKLTAFWDYTSLDDNDESDLQSVIESGHLSGIDNPLKRIIFDATYKIMDQGVDYLVSIFEDNAGVIKLDKKGERTAAHKVETHNSPSHIEGFGGAITGIVGVYRDPNGVGKSQRVYAGDFGFRCAHPDSYQDLPAEIQHPLRFLDTIIEGVEQGGNKSGISTLGGAPPVLVDQGWLKGAVYVDAKSTAPAKVNGIPTHTKDVKPGYVAINIGGRVGKDGIGGATVSSSDFKAGDEEREDINQHVQMGNPLVEKEVFEVMEVLRGENLIQAAQDCGAGGWNSAVGELTGLVNDLEKARYDIQTAYSKAGITEESSVADMIIAAMPVVNLKKKASPFIDQIKYEIETKDIFHHESNGKGGCVMDLTNAPEKYKGMMGWEKLISESQERMVIVVKPEDADRVFELCKHWDVEATQMAVFDDTGYYHVKDQSETINFLPIDFMEQGLPQMKIKAVWKPSDNYEPDIESDHDLTETFLDIMGRPNMQSYEFINRRFDHEVGGGTLIKPIVGRGGTKTDTCAIKPNLEYDEIVLTSWGTNPGQGDIDGYHMGKNNVVDAIGRIICGGGNLEKLTFNGNTTCPKPEKDEGIAATVIRMWKGSADAEIAFGTPRISGKDSTSLQRDYKSTETGEVVVVKAKPEMLMSAQGVVYDESTLTTPDFKLPGDLIYIIGDTKDECGASEWYLMNEETGRNVPKSNIDEIKPRYNSVVDAIKEGIVHSAQYVWKGGVSAALANSALGGDLGVIVALDDIDEGLGRADKLAIGSESTGRMLVTVHRSQKDKFEKIMKEHYCKAIGVVREDKKFRVAYNDKIVINTNVDTIREVNRGNIKY